MGGAKSSALTELKRCGQSPWLDNIDRAMLRSGALARLVRLGDVTGLTSNPTIFEKAIATGRDYDADILALVRKRRTSAAIVDALTTADIRAACDVFKPVYAATKRADGYVSIEVSPDLARDTDATVREAGRIWRAVKRPNLMVKIPATAEGVPAIAATIAKGINVNVTLIFSLERYAQVIDAYLQGLERLAAAGKKLERVASVASFFVSRLDTAVDALLDERVGTVSGTARTQLEQLRGKAAIANAKLAYEQFREAFTDDRFTALQQQGARVQRPLWASTSTKNPAYPDVYYVEALIGADTVNTLPPQTLVAYKDHGVPEPRVHLALDRARQVVSQLAQQRIDLDAITARLEVEGVASFAASWASLHATVEARRDAILLGDRAGISPGKARSKVDQTLTAMEKRGFGPGLDRRDAALWDVDAAGRAEIADRFGWLDCPVSMPAEIDRLEAFVADVRRARLTKVVLCGMGGSSLAPAVLAAVLGSRRGALALRVLDSTNPDVVRATDAWADPKKTLYLLASKSGTTTEVQAFFRHFWERATRVRGDRAGAHFAAITDPGTPLVDLATEHAFRATFENPSDIGGRFSALSLFGLVPAALAGVDLRKLLERAAVMGAACKGVVRPDLNPGLSLGALLAGAARSGRERLTLSLPDRLAAFGDWVEQLVAESSGKAGTGIVPLLGEAPDDIIDAGRVFVDLRLGAARQQPLAARARAGHPTAEIRLADPYDVAAEFVRWEVAVTAACWALGVNPFDQPDVQATKDYTRRLLMQLGRGHRPHVENALDAGTPDFGDTLRAALQEPKGRRYVALLCYFMPTAARDRLVASLRSSLAAQLRLPVTLGYGPRYLHSTGQLHKGGADTVLPLILTADAGEDLAIPGTDYTFGMLERAQAEGDAEALREAGRPVVRVQLGAAERGLKAMLAALAPAGEVPQKRTRARAS